MTDQRLAKADEGGPLGRRFRSEKPQKVRNEARSSSASASLTSDRSCQTDSSSALNMASGGHAGSPFALA